MGKKLELYKKLNTWIDIVYFGGLIVIFAIAILREDWWKVITGPKAEKDFCDSTYYSGGTNSRCSLSVIGKLPMDYFFSFSITFAALETILRLILKFFKFTITKLCKVSTSVSPQADTNDGITVENFREMTQREKENIDLM